MSVTSWDVFTLVSRAGIYLGMAGAIGGSFSLLVFERSPLPAQPLWRYLRWSCLLGLLSTGLYFLIRTAALGGNPSAAFDPTLLSIMTRSVLGDSAALLASAFALILLASFALRRSSWIRRLGFPGLAIGLVALLWGFPVAGHLAEHNIFNRLALALHVLAMSLWIGSFYPLLHLMKSNQARHNLKLYGDIAVGIVGLLITCGVWLGFVLIPDFSTLFYEDYGRALLFKVGLVTMLLLLAASHKWYWVPRFSEPGTAKKLGISIRAEMLLGIGVLLTTAAMSSLMSPSH